jgi:myo-inositol-1-phosphate synthase
MSKRIRIAIAGVGNCASALVQGISYYRRTGATAGLAHPSLGGYAVGDIDVVAAFDIDARKVGRTVAEAIVAPPNNTAIFEPNLACDTPVQMGPVLDGVAEHMANYPEHLRFMVSMAAVCDVAAELRDGKADVLVSYMPVGARRATEFYAHAALAAGVSLVNCLPEFIVSDREWSRRFTAAGIPCVGDDVKSQLGATVTHRTLTRLFADRGLPVQTSYQLNVGGTTDFLNMLDRSRLTSKKESKTQAVQSQMNAPMPEERLHVGPSDFVPFLKDKKVCFLRMEGEGFAGSKVELELRLSSEDSPNSAGMVVDAIRACAIARDRGVAGPLMEASAWTMKHPPLQMRDSEALAALDEWAAGIETKRR